MSSNYQVERCHFRSQKEVIPSPVVTKPRQKSNKAFLSWAIVRKLQPFADKEIFVDQQNDTWKISLRAAVGFKFFNSNALDSWMQLGFRSPNPHRLISSC